MLSSSAVGLTAKGLRAISSMSASQMEFPKTASGVRPITSRIAYGLPLPLGTRMTLSVTLPLDCDSRRQNPVRRNSGMFHTCSDDPLAGRRDGPDFAAESLQLEYQYLHVGENPSSIFSSKNGTAARTTSASASPRFMVTIRRTCRLR